MAVSRLFTEVGKDIDRMNESLRQSLNVAEQAGIKVAGAGKSMLSAFDSALNPTKNLSEQLRLLEAAGKSQADIWQVMGDRMKTAAAAAQSNSQAVDPLVQKYIELGKASQQSSLSFESLGKTIQDFAANPVQATQSGITNLLAGLGPTAVGIGAVATGAIAAGVAIYEFAAKAAAAAESVKNLSYATGMSVEDVQALQRLGEERGLGDLTGMIEKLNAQLGSASGGTFVEAILRMNIAIKDGAGATYYLEEMRKKYAEIPDPIKRAEQAAADLGRRLIHELGPIVLNTDESITKAMQDIESSGAVMGKSQVDMLARLNKQIEEHGRLWEGLKNQIKTSVGLIEATITGSTFWKNLLSGNIATAFSKGVAEQLSGALNQTNQPVPGAPSASPGASVLSEDTLNKRARAVAEADAIAAGTKKNLIGLTAQLNELEKQYSEEKTKQKSLNQFDEQKLKSAAAEINAIKQQIEQRKELNKQEEDFEKRFAEFNKGQGPLYAEEAKLRMENQLEVDKIIAQSEKDLHDGVIKWIDDEAKKREKNEEAYKSFEESISKDIESADLAHLKIEGQINDTITPRNAAEREIIEVQKIHMAAQLQAEEVKIKYAQMRLELESKIAKIQPGTLAYDQAIEDMGKLGQAENQALKDIGDLESAKVLQVHQQEYNKMIDSVREGAGKVFDAISSRGKGAFQSLMDWIEGIFLSKLRMLFQNLMEGMFTGKLSTSSLLAGVVPSLGGNISMGGLGGTAPVESLELVNGVWQMPAAAAGGNAQGGGLSSILSRLFGGGTSGSSDGGLFAKGGMLSQLLGGAGLMLGSSLFMDSFSTQGGAGWGKSIGGGALAGGGIGMLLGGPIGAAIGAEIGAMVGAIKQGIQTLIHSITGKTTEKAGSMEVSRDLGGISYSSDSFKKFYQDAGLTSGQAWPIRKNLIESPKFLVEQALPIAEQSGKMDDLLKSLEKVGTSWGTFDFRSAFQVGQLTGDWTELNKVWKETSQLGTSLDPIKQNAFNTLLEGVDKVLSPAEQLVKSLGNLKTSLKNSIAPIETMYDDFLKTGKITDEFKQQIESLGGDLSKFEALSGLMKINTDFQSLLQHFQDTGEVLPGLRKMFTDFGGDLSVLDNAAALPGLKSSLNSIQSLTSGLSSIATEFDPINKLLAGTMDADVMAALQKTGLDPSKFTELTQMIGMEKNWSKIAQPFTVMTDQLKEALLQYGGTAGQEAVSKYGQGFNTITESLLSSTKAAMDQAYQQQVKGSLDYLGTAADQTNAQISTLTTAVSDEASKVSDNISKAINDAKNAIVDALGAMAMAAAKNIYAPSAAGANQAAASPAEAFLSSLNLSDYLSKTNPETGQIYNRWEALVAYLKDHPQTAAQLASMGANISAGGLGALAIPQAAGGGLIQVHDQEVILDRDQTRNLFRSGGQSGAINLYMYNSVINGWNDFVEQVRRAGLDLKRRGISLAEPGY